MEFYPFDLYLDPVNLVLKIDLDIVKMYVYTENDVCRLQEFKSYILNRQTDRQTEGLD